MKFGLFTFHLAGYEEPFFSATSVNPSPAAVNHRPRTSAGMLKWFASALGVCTNIVLNSLSLVNLFSLRCLGASLPRGLSYFLTVLDAFQSALRSRCWRVDHAS